MSTQPKTRRIALLIDQNEYYTRTVTVGIRKFFRTRERWICETLDPWGGSAWDWVLDGKWDGIVAYAFDKSLITFLQTCGIPSVNVSNSLPPTDKIPRVVRNGACAISSTSETAPTLRDSASRVSMKLSRKRASDATSYPPSFI
jgi:hypothetical protein